MNNEEIEAQIIKINQKSELTKKDRKRLKKLERRIVRDRESRFKGITALLKLGAIVLVVLIAIGAVWIVFRQSKVPAGEVVSQNGLHWHPKLTIVIDGKKQEIPADIGIGAVHQEIHTHDKDAKDGVVHMEMSGTVTKDETKLSNIFKIWGEEFNATQILDRKNGAQGSVKMMVNGKGNKDFENYLMKDKDIIEIRYEK